MDLFGMDSGWWWLLAGLLLAVAEMLVPGVFLIWLGAAALLTGVASLAFDLPLGAEFLLFAIAAVAAVYCGWRWFANNPIESTDPLLNEPIARMVGETGIVVEPIADGHGRLRVGDSQWNAEGPDTPVGTRMRITAVRGSALIVEPILTLQA